jgi:hypothetical protein
MTTPRVSVCLRSVDRPQSLRAAVRGVLAQEFTDLELIVSSDGAPLECLVREFDDPRLQVTHNPGAPGATANLAHAISLASGELLALLDDDDEWAPGFLSALVPAFDADDRLGVAFCDYDLVAGDTLIPHPWPWPSGPQPEIAARLLDRSIPPSAAVIRRTTFHDGERLLPLRPDLAGAATIWLRAAAQGWSFQHVPGSRVRYRMHPGQMSWSAETTAARFAATLDRLHFDAATPERVRLARLAEAYCTQAGVRLRRGDLRHAAVLLRSARRYGPLSARRNLIALSGIRRLVARHLPAHPRLLALALPVWQRVRPRPG